MRFGRLAFTAVAPPPPLMAAALEGGNDSRQSDVRRGRLQAEAPGVWGWFALGLFFPIVGVLIAYLRQPRVPVRLLVHYETPGDAAWFRQAYMERLSERRRRAAWWGIVTGVVLGGLVIAAGFAVMASEMRELERELMNLGVFQ